jgi:RNase P subunit RPR2
MLRKCKECRKELPYADFYIKGKTKTNAIKRDTVCKSCKSVVRSRLVELYGESGLKECTCCRKTLPWDEFSFRIDNKKRYLRSKCKSCSQLKWDSWVTLHPEHKEKKLESDRKAHKNYKKYHRRGITKAQYNLLFEIQNGVCIICANPAANGKDLAIDHNHKTGEVRWLLCLQCNRGLGLFGDSINRLEQAVLYLQQRGSYGGK